MARTATGTIRKRKAGVYELAVTLTGVHLAAAKLSGLHKLADDAAGLEERIQRRHYETVYGSRQDAQRRLVELQHQEDTGTMPTGKVKLAAWLDYWLREFVVPTRRPRTVDDYRRQVRLYLAPHLGHLEIGQLARHHVREFQNRMAQQLGTSSVAKLRQILGQAVKEANAEGLIPTNPVALTAHPGHAKPSGKAASMDHVQHIIADSAAKGDRFAVLYQLLAGTGLRIGEALALDWHHVDLRGRRVVVEYTTTATADGLTLGPPKSTNSYREVPISGALVDALIDHRVKQDAMRDSMGERYRDRGLVFPKMREGQAGGLLANRQVQKALAVYGTHPHALRHFFGTQLFEAGFTLPRVSKLMGHANIGITASIYIHPGPDGDREAIDALAARMDANSGFVAGDAVDALLSNAGISEGA